MRFLSQSCILLDRKDPDEILNKIERAYRICYLSESNANRDEFIKSKIKAKHESPLEHESISIEVVTNRAIANEIVRHRIASYSQESTRYVNYSKEKFDNEIKFIKPHWFDTSGTNGQDIYTEALEYAEIAYKKLIKHKRKPEESRGILPLDTATRLIITMNMREWRHFFNLRYVGTTGRPDPNMKILAEMILKKFKDYVPVIFDDFMMEKENKK